MAMGTKIEWTDATWNPITGCSVISPGCTNCYAMRLAGGRMKHHPSRAGLTYDSKAGPVWNGQVRLNEPWLRLPLGWSKPCNIFVGAHTDLFHENIADRWLDLIFAVVALTPHHKYQVLTKRTERAAEYLGDLRGRPVRVAAAMGEILDAAIVAIDVEKVRANWPLRNVQLGFSAEDHARLTERGPDVHTAAAAVRFASLEPLLGPIALRSVIAAKRQVAVDLLTGYWWRTYQQETAYRGAPLDQVIVGGESGPGARPMHPDWARRIRDDCERAGVPFFFKQWGDWMPVEALDGVVGGLSPSDRRVAYMAADGCRDDALRHREEREGQLDPTAWYFVNVGKKAAGRLLDGVIHDAMPEAA